MASKILKLGSLPLRQTAFFLCDMQEKFRPLISYFQEVSQNCNRLVKMSEILQIPLFVTEQYPESLGHTACEIKTDHAVGVFPKKQFSMCIPEIVKEMERIKDLQCVVLFGIATHICVEQTAMDLRERGLVVHVVADASTSIRLEDRLLAFQRMDKIGCFITTSENVVFKLVGGKDHPRFDDIIAFFKKGTPYTGLYSLEQGRL